MHDVQRVLAPVLLILHLTVLFYTVIRLLLTDDWQVSQLRIRLILQTSQLSCHSQQCLQLPTCLPAKLYKFAPPDALFFVEQANTISSFNKFMSSMPSGLTWLAYGPYTN